MHLSDYSLHQIDDAYIQSLEVEALRNLSLRLLADLQEARERLNQGPTNSSRPPSSRAPWERENITVPTDDNGTSVTETAEAPPTVEAIPTTGAPPATTPTVNAPPRKPGKQPGAPGFGRTQVLTAHHTQAPYPATCAGCSQSLTDLEQAVAYTGFQAIDVRGGELGA